MTSAQVTGFIVATLRLSTPLLLAASGELVAEESGVLNLSVEGMMLSGTLAGFLGTYCSGSLLCGWAAAMAAGLLVAAVFSAFAVALRCHQVIVALGVNLLVSGGTAFAYRTMFGFAPSTPEVQSAGRVALPWLHRLPWIGPVLFDHDVLMYAAFLAPVAVRLLLYHSRWGTSVRAVGENPRAAEADGISVQRTRWQATLFGGALAGLAGAYYSTVDLNVFLEDMTGGAGWIAVAIVIFGNWRPAGLYAAALTFGAAQALQLRLQGAGLGVPREFVVMLPYVVTLAALAGVIHRSHAPKQLCVPFVPTGE